MKNKRLVEMLIGLLLLLAIGCAVLAVYAGDRMASHWGPRILEQAPSGEVWLVLDQELFIASAGGELRHQVPLSELNLPGPVNAIVPLPDRGGATRMLLGVIDMPEWLVMNENGQVERRITPSGIDIPFSETFHLAAAPDGRIAMSTGGDHRVLLFDARGEFLAQSERGLFRFANGLWFENGQWFVVDTNHHQLRALNGETLKSEAVIGVPAVGGAFWPALARRGIGVEGGITLSEMQNGMQYGVVLEMSESGKLLHEYRSHAGNPQPMGFLWLNGHLLLADSDDFSLQMFDRKGTHLGAWGDANITAALKNAIGQRQFWSSVLLGARVGAILLGVLAIIGYFVLKRREAAVVGLADHESIHLGTPCLGKTDELLGKLSLFWPLILLMTAILIIPQFLIMFLALSPGGMKAVLAYSWAMPVLGVAGALLIWLAFFTHKVMQARVHDPRFEAVLSSHWVRWAVRAKVLQEVLENGEHVQEVLMLYTSRLFPVFSRHVWVLSNRRILIFELRTSEQGKMLASVSRCQISANIKPARGWFWWTEAFGNITLQLPDGLTFQGYPSSPVTAKRIKDLLAIQTAVPHKLVQAESISLAAVEPGARSLSLSPIVAFLLSLLLPGAAQLMQSRFVLGLVLLSIMLVHVAFVLTPVLLGWVGHFYDVSMRNGIFSILFAIAWALLSAWDAWNYAHRCRSGVISSRH